MSAQPRLEPRFGNRPAFGGTQEQNLHKNRYIFSPVQRLDCSNKVYGEVNFTFIEPRTIHLIDDVRHPIRSEKRIQEEAKTESEWVAHTRAAAHVLDGILRNAAYDGNIATGVGELPDLIGLDASASVQDANLLIDIERTLLPQSSTDGFSLLEHLMSKEAEAAQKGSIYAATLERMASLTNTAIDYYRLVAQDLRDQLAQRAKGGDHALGNRGRLYEIDKAIFAWVREPVPQLVSPFAGKTPSSPMTATAATVAQVQCIKCGAFANIIQATGLPPEQCGNCKKPFPQPATEQIKDDELI